MYEARFGVQASPAAQAKLALLLKLDGHVPLAHLKNLQNPR